MNLAPKEMCIRDRLEGLTHRRDCHKTRAFRNLRGECDMLLAVGLAELLDEQQEITVTQIVQTRCV